MTLEERIVDNGNSFGTIWELRDTVKRSKERTAAYLIKAQYRFNGFSFNR